MWTFESCWDSIYAMILFFISILLPHLQCFFLSFNVICLNKTLILTWDTEISLENYTRASALNELTFFSEFSTARLELSESVFSEEMSASQVIQKTLHLSKWHSRHLKKKSHFLLFYSRLKRMSIYVFRCNKEFLSFRWQTIFPLIKCN